MDRFEQIEDNQLMERIKYYAQQEFNKRLKDFIEWRKTDGFRKGFVNEYQLTTVLRGKIVRLLKGTIHTRSIGNPKTNSR